MVLPLAERWIIRNKRR